MKEYSLIELIDGLSSKKWTSRDLVTMYLDEINKNNLSGKELNAVASLNPDAYQIADMLDLERKIKGPRSILHGIPILIKDNINTADKMPTTASSYALRDFFSPYDASVVEKLREAGMIILGKTNLSEFAYFMSFDDMPSGYGSLHGQVKNPYSDKIDPLGSSTGSAVAVASNMIPVSVGTETNGSLMAPALANSITSIKPTVGLVSRYGIIPISPDQDSAGPMGRSVLDCAILLQHMIGKDHQDVHTLTVPKQNFDFINAYKLPIEGLKVGFIQFEGYPYEEDELAIIEEAKQVFLAKKVEVVDIPFTPKQMRNDITLVYEFKNALNYYFKTVSSTCPIHTLKELIEYNHQHADRCLKHGQSIFTKSEETSGSLRELEYQETKKEIMIEAARFEDIMNENQISALISTRRTSYAPVYGNPSISVVAKPLTDELPRSLVFVGKKFDDEILTALSHHYE
ncbi:MAG: amidase family protein, partial [Candidatus Izemoplasmatales bacterium]